MKTYRGSLSQTSPSLIVSSFCFSDSDISASFLSLLLLRMLSLVRSVKAARNESIRHLIPDVNVCEFKRQVRERLTQPKSRVLFGIHPRDQSRSEEPHCDLTTLVNADAKDKSPAHMETQLEIETINAVPTPRLDVGEKVFDAQLL